MKKSKPHSVSTSGYAENAASLVQQYEGLVFSELFEPVESELLKAIGPVLDVGSGSGRDAAEFAKRGYAVTAVEPVAELRERAREIHKHCAIEWVDDSLPGLRLLGRRKFGLVWLSAVWMHLDCDERISAMSRVSGLLEKGGKIVITTRHGPVPSGRRMYSIAVSETVELAESNGLTCSSVRYSVPDVGGREAVSWDFLVLRSVEDCEAKVGLG